MKIYILSLSQNINVFFFSFLFPTNNQKAFLSSGQYGYVLFLLNMVLYSHTYIYVYDNKNASMKHYTIKQIQSLHSRVLFT